jgi:putative isomerase
MSEYKKLKNRLASGWNTWNTRSVLSHVLLPSGFSINLGLKEYKDGNYLKEVLVGRLDSESEKVHPGLRSFDGSYTELHLEWKGITLFIQSAKEQDDLLLLVTPIENQKVPVTLIVESGFLWNREGYVTRTKETLVAHLPEKDVNVHVTEPVIEEVNVETQSPFLAIRLDKCVGISTGRKRSTKQIAEMITESKHKEQKRIQKYGELADVYEAVQTCLAWDTIYDPMNDRVVSPVTRIWNCRKGGYALFCWDNYFAAYMASLENKDLAYANAIEITREKVDRGFVPNCAWGNGFKSHDRSQPPVGSLVVKELYRKFNEEWLLEEVFDDLYEWNSWWFMNRKNGTLLSWGSTPYEPVVGNYWETTGVNDLFGGALESGLDNSPMYDGIPFNKETHLMQLHDVGLNGLYVLDCYALAEIANVLKKEDKATELTHRAEVISKNMNDLWCEQEGIYLNRIVGDQQEFSKRLSPTHFYPLLGKVPTQEQAERMINEHFFNPEEFYGEWIMPSIARNDPAYPDQDYWRGRIWAPMNFLVYLGLRNYRLLDAQKVLAEKSKELLLKEWLKYGHVHENYNADTGEGCDKPNSDRFYHWGALLGIISLIEEGHLAGPEEELLVAANRIISP